jgi:hypothetical protein
MRAATAALGVLAVVVGACNSDGGTRPRASSRALDFGGPSARITLSEASHVTSIRLTRRVPPRVLETCRAAARQPAAAVTCPRLVPRGGIYPDRDLYGQLETSRDLHVLSFNNGFNGRYVHWVVGAGTKAAVDRTLIDDRWHEVAGLPRRVRLLRLGNTPIAVYRFQDPAGGYLSGHTAAFAEDGGRVVFVSIHGYAHADADVAMLADMLATR